MAILLLFCFVCLKTLTLYWFLPLSSRYSIYVKSKHLQNYFYIDNKAIYAFYKLYLMGLYRVDRVTINCRLFRIISTCDT